MSTVAYSFIFIVLISSVNALAQNPVPTTEQLQTDFAKARSFLPNNADSAIYYFRKLNADATQLENDEFIAKSNYMIGTSYYFLSQFYVALDFLEKSLQSSYTKTNLTLYEYILNNMGIMYDKTGNLVEALRVYQKSLEIAEQNGDSSSVAQSWLNISLLLDQQNQTIKSIDLTNKALHFFERTQDTLNIALAHQNLAKFKIESDLTDETESHLLKALALFEKLDDQYSVAKSNYNISAAQIERGLYKEAENRLLTTLLQTRNLGMPDILSDVYISLAEIKTEEKLYSQASTLLDSAFAINQRNKLSHNRDIYYKAVFNLLVRTANSERFRKEFSDYKSFKEKVFSEKTSSVFQEMMVLYDAEKLKVANAKLESDLIIRNDRIFYLAIVIIIILGATIAIYIQYGRIKKQNYLLFKKTIDQNEIITKSIQRSLNTKPHNPEQKDSIDLVNASLEDEENQFDSLFEKIKLLMEKDQLYLNKRLKIQDISTELATNNKYISIAINEATKNSFTYFVNQYRINNAIYLLKTSNNNSPINFDTISEMSGFNSRSSFNRQFAEFTGLSPSQFLSILQKEPANSEIQLMSK